MRASSFPGTVFTSRWETDRVNGGVSGVGNWSVSFEIDGVQFNTAISRFEKFVDEEKLIRSSTGYRDNWTGATAGNYQHPCKLSKEQVLSLLASIFEYEEKRPLNPFRLQPRMIEAIKAYAKIAEKDLNLFVRGYLYPLPHPSYEGRGEEWEKKYLIERTKVLSFFGMQ